MRLLMFLVAFAVSGYMFLWGVSWLMGDRSVSVMTVTDVGSYSAYPGVLLGGLPPIPSGASDLPMLVSALAGAFGMVAMGFGAVRLRGT